MSMACFIFVLVAAQSSAADSGVAIPKSIEAFRQSRYALFSGTVEWQQESAMKLPGRIFNFTNRYAACGDRIFEELGDQEGWVQWNTADKRPVSRYPHLYLENADGVYTSRETDPSFEWWKPTRAPARQEPTRPTPLEFKDVRFIGMHPAATTGFQERANAPLLLEQVGEGVPVEPPRVRWSEKVENGKYVATAEMERHVIRWVIDPERGWNAERIEVLDRAGSVTSEVRCRLRQFDGVWFPESVEHYHNGILGTRIVVSSAQFNRPDDPVEFGPNDIRVEAGFNVVPQNFKTASGYPVLIWDGQQALESDEWRELVRTGARQYGPILAEAHRRGGPPESPYATDGERARASAVHREMRLRSDQAKGLSLWERYVAEFIQQHSLNADQTQKAQTILRSCQEEGQDYLNRRRNDFARAQRAIETARQSGDAQELARADEKLRELRKPIDAIFEERLKPRLNRLLTTAQRAAAASQPAAASGEPR